MQKFKMSKEVCKEKGATIMQQLNPNRLIDARKARGLTQEALGNLIGKTKGFVSKLENGSSRPSATTMIRLSDVLNLPVGWFSLKTLQSEKRVYQFRSSATATKTVKELAKTRLNWLKEISLSLEEWVDYPKVNLIASPSRKEALVITDEQIESLANDLRLFWKLGNRPIKNLIATVETNGIIVSKEHIYNAGMDGVSTWIDRPFIWVAEDKGNFFRTRFDVAHELGHIILHKNLTVEDCLITEEKHTMERYKEMERQAHLFASHFLAPRSALSLSFRSITLDNLLLEKKRWGISVAALIMQYHNLGIISDEYKVRLFKNYSYRKWRKCEPLDDTTPVENPKLMRNTIELLLTEGGFDKEDVIERTFYNKMDLETLCALPEGFFDNEQQISKPHLRLL